MSIQGWINNNPVAATILAVVVLGVAIVAVVLQMGDGPPEAADEAFYFDPRTETFFVADRWTYPPVQTPGGEETGLQAHIYACGPCPQNIDGMTLAELEQTDAFVNRFERYSEEARQILAGTDRRALEDDPEPEPQFQRALEAGAEVRRPADDNWIPADSLAGEEMFEQAFAACEDREGALTRCEP